MLTEEQIEKLQLYIKHPKYGKLLQSAVKNWEYTTPSPLVFGVSTMIRGLNDCERKLFYIATENHRCCLIGSSLIGVEAKPFSSHVESACLEFNISPEEFGGLMSGFDSSSYEDPIPKDWPKEAWEFGRIIGKIVCMEKY